MSMFLHREIERLKRRILTLSAGVENNVRQAILAVEERDPTLAMAVVRSESQTDREEVDVEEECLKILALHAPVAADLRYIVAVLRINHDLERIGDLAVHIAEQALLLCERPRLVMGLPLGPMAEKARAMLKRVLDAFVNLDAEAAWEVWEADSEIDELNHEISRKAREAIAVEPQLFESLLLIMHLARHLERIADHATNIAEDLIYLVRGKIVRHSAAIGSREG